MRRSVWSGFDVLEDAAHLFSKPFSSGFDKDPPLPWASLAYPPHDAAASLYSAKQRPGDEQTLDLVGAFVDLGDLGVAIEPLDLDTADIALTAVDLYRVGGVLDGGIAGKALRHRAFGRRPPPGVEQQGSVLDHQA